MVPALKVLPNLFPNRLPAELDVFTVFVVGPNEVVDFFTNKLFEVVESIAFVPPNVELPNKSPLITPIFKCELVVPQLLLPNRLSGVDIFPLTPIIP